MRLRHQAVTSIAAALVTIIAPAVRISGTAAADDTVLLGGGGGIVIDGTYCTLTTIGHDGGGELVGFTASHCGGPGAQVVAEGAENHGPLGSVARTDRGLLYSVIKFDPAKVTPTANFAGFPINGIGPDPEYGATACTQGGATGQGCGGIGVPTVVAGVIGARMPAWQPGDFGAPVTVDGMLVGLTQNGVDIVQTQRLRVVMHTGLTLFSAILNDTNAKGFPGAGFSPIPA